MNHTKEPWIITSPGLGVIEGDNHIFLAEVDGRTAQEIIANTSRIVACVNACAGITDAVIEEGIIKKALIAYLGSYDENITWKGMKVWEGK